MNDRIVIIYKNKEIKYVYNTPYRSYMIENEKKLLYIVEYIKDNLVHKDSHLMSDIASCQEIGNFNSKSESELWGI